MIHPSGNKKLLGSDAQGEGAEKQAQRQRSLRAIRMVNDSRRNVGLCTAFQGGNEGRMRRLALAGRAGPRQGRDSPNSLETTTLLKNIGDVGEEAGQKIEEWTELVGDNLNHTESPSPSPPPSEDTQKHIEDKRTVDLYTNRSV